MTEVRIGSWIIDLAAGTAIDGNLRITVAAEDDGSFTLRFYGDVPAEDRYRTAREALDVLERAQVLKMWQGKE